MDIHKEFATNKKSETDGIWLALETGKPGEVLIARLQNVNWRRAARRLPKSIRRQMNDDLLPEGTMDEITAELMSKTIVLGWRDLYKDGKPLDYSQETCFEILLEYPDFRARLYELASDVENFRKAEMDDLGKDYVPQYPGT